MLIYPMKEYVNHKLDIYHIGFTIGSLYLEFYIIKEEAEEVERIQSSQNIDLNPADDIESHEVIEYFHFTFKSDWNWFAAWRKGLFFQFVTYLCDRANNRDLKIAHNHDFLKSKCKISLLFIYDLIYSQTN
eukprot:NODE_311_length_10039_cov_0.864487.p10 type:complete len:131 gc:universal NODE_311_length_10039_cov_0.864487:8454-8062(-)